MKYKSNPDFLDEGKDPIHTPAASYFFCYTCGAILTTAEDRKQHLEKEARGDISEHLTH
jgi:hypothetical protein